MEYSLLYVLFIETDDIYEDIEETVGNNSPSKTTGVISHIPPHSLTAFSLFLRLPGYAEVLLKDSKKALCLLRLMLGVTDDGEGNNIIIFISYNTILNNISLFTFRWRHFPIICSICIAHPSL